MSAWLYNQPKTHVTHTTTRQCACLQKQMADRHHHDAAPQPSLHLTAAAAVLLIRRIASCQVHKTARCAFQLPFSHLCCGIHAVRCQSESPGASLRVHLQKLFPAHLHALWQSRHVGSNLMDVIDQAGRAWALDLPHFWRANTLDTMRVESSCVGNTGERGPVECLRG